MAFSATNEANGVRVVTHIIPIEEKKPLEQQVISVKPEKSKLPPKTRMFLKGKPMPLGLVQVFTGLVIMSLCAITILVDMLHADFVICLGLPFVISGSVAIAAHKRSSPCLIKATLAMSVICALLAAAGTGYFCWELSNRPAYNLCDDTNDRYWDCWRMTWTFHQLMDGVRGLLLALSFLELCVCISLSVFSARAVCQDETDDDHYGSDSQLLKTGLE